MEKETKVQYSHMMIKYFILLLLFFSCKTNNIQDKSLERNVKYNEQRITGFLDFDDVKDVMICNNNIFLDSVLGPYQKCEITFGNKDSLNLKFFIRKNSLVFSNEKRGIIGTFESSGGNLGFEETNYYEYDSNYRKWFNIKVNSKEYENGVLVDSINETFEKAYSLDLKMYKVNGRVYVNEEN